MTSQMNDERNDEHDEPDEANSTALPYIRESI